MTVNITLALLVGVLIGSGVVLLMARGIVRAFLGVTLLSNGINLLFMIASGDPGRAPIIDPDNPERMSDPLPQALVLTAIVITLSLTGFVLSLAYRFAQTSASDLIVDDAEDTRLHELAAEQLDQPSDLDVDLEAIPEPDEWNAEPTGTGPREETR